jgi:phage tail-like protein
MTPPAARNDPYRKFNFIVEIDGIASSAFQFVDGLESTSDVIDYREGGEANTPRKLPGLNKFSNITLKRGVTANRDLWQWRRTVLDGATERRNGAIIVLNEAREEVLRYYFEMAWPCRWKISGLDALESQVLVEEVELVIENLRLVE